MQLILNVPDNSDMAAEIAGWQDGASYSFKAIQTSANTFDVTEATAAEPDDAEMMEEGMPMEATEYPNPAVARVMKGK